MESRLPLDESDGAVVECDRGRRDVTPRDAGGGAFERIAYVLPVEMDGSNGDIVVRKQRVVGRPAAAAADGSDNAAAAAARGRIDVISRILSDGTSEDLLSKLLFTRRLASNPSVVCHVCRAEARRRRDNGSQTTGHAGE